MNVLDYSKGRLQKFYDPIKEERKLESKNK